MLDFTVLALCSVIAMFTNPTLLVPNANNRCPLLRHGRFVIEFMLWLIFMVGMMLLFISLIQFGPLRRLFIHN
jgi:hypothetical protein